MLPITLLFEQSLEEAQGHLTQFMKSLAQLLDLPLIVVRRTMFRIDALLARLPRLQRMPRQFADVTIIDEEFGLRDPRRQNFAYQPPRHRVLIVLIGNEAFHIHNTIHHARRVIVVLGQRQ